MNSRKPPQAYKGTTSTGARTPTSNLSKTHIPYNAGENDSDSIKSGSPPHYSAKVDLKKEYIRFCKLYSSEPLDIVAGPLEKASEYGHDSVVVDLRGRGLRGVDCIAISKILGLDAPISQLNLSDCLLLPQGFQALVDGLCKNSRLQTLELRGNNIQNDMTKSLAKLLRTNCSLKILVLEWNSLGCCDSFGIFSEAISINIGLEELDLRNNSLTADCAVQLANAMQTNKSLRELDLRWNSIGLVGAKALWESLHYNFSLQKMCLCGNYIPDDIVRSIEQCLQHQSERESMMQEFSKRTTILTRQLKKSELQHQNEITSIVSVFDAEEAELKDAIKESYEQINDLDSKLQSETVRSQSLVKQVEKLQTSLACANEKEETLRKALEMKEEHTEQLETFFKTEMENLKSNHDLRIKNFQEELESRYKHIETMSSKIGKVESMLELKTSELQDCQERIDCMKKEASDNRKHFEDRLKSEKEKWANWKDELETSEKREINSLEEEIRQIQSTMSAHIKKLEKGKADAEEEIRQMKIKFVKLKAEAEEELTKMRNQIAAEYDKIVENISNQLNVAKEQIGKLESDQQKSLAELRKFESENVTLVRQNENLRQQISNMDKELLEKDAQIHTSLSRARSEVKDQIEQLAKEEEANKTLRIQVLELQEQIAMLTLKQNREIQEKFAEMEHWKTQVERREVELNRLKEEDMRRAALLHEAFLAYMRSTSAATGIPLPDTFFQQGPLQLITAQIPPVPIPQALVPIKPVSTTKVEATGPGIPSPSGDAPSKT